MSVELHKECPLMTCVLSCNHHHARPQVADRGTASISLDVEVSYDISGLWLIE